MTETKKYDNVYWRKLRREKEIPLRPHLNAFIGCSYNLVSMWETGKANMVEDKIERYIAFVEAYPEEPSGVVTKEDKFKE